MILSMIVAHSQNLVIGNEGKVPWHISEDLKHFKEATLGYPIVMGRKTFESIGFKALKDRKNFVLSTSLENVPEGVTLLRDPAHVFDIETKADKIFIIGGSFLYNYYLPFATELLITEVMGEYQGDTFFPEYRDKIGTKWQELSREEFDGFSFINYQAM